MLLLTMYSAFRWKEGRDPDASGVWMFFGMVELLAELALIGKLFGAF